MRTYPSKRAEILELHATGLSPSEIADRLGVSKGLVSYYLGSSNSQAVAAALASPSLEPVPDLIPEDDPGDVSGVSETDRDRSLEVLRQVRDGEIPAPVAEQTKAAVALLQHATGPADEWEPEEGQLRVFIAELRTRRPELF